MKTISDSKLKAFFFFFLFCFLLTGVACSFQEQQIAAQTNQSNKPNIETGGKNFEFLKQIGDPCRFLTAEGGQLPPSKEIYELQNAGYPKAVSLDEATAVFNRFAGCNKVGKTQPPLRPEEVIGAIAAWSCAEETEALQTKPYDKNTCQQFEEIIKNGNLPKGGWLEYNGGTCENCKGYTVEVSEIRLYLKLDKYRRDYKGNPIISRLIRLNYPSAKQNEE